ncbi:MAG TPA: hypothetical protein VJH68_01135 [Candidatus Nanoarchaeia archaeon]|nr:hypothetical protein [Candidatus Nanoarchaeia archaeon]
MDKQKMPRTTGTLAAVVLSSAIGFGGCCLNPEYNFKGKIGEDQVRFYERGIYGANHLEVITSNGDIISYLDSNDDFQLDRVNITSGENTAVYFSHSKNEAVKKVLAEAQKRFESYLAKIIEINTRSLRE